MFKTYLKKKNICNEIIFYNPNTPKSCMNSNVK